MERITPEQIDDLGENGIFVFGSNESGIHGAGAAAFAKKNFGAYQDQGFGLMNKSFGIPTKDWVIQKLPLEAVKFYVNRFIAFTRRYNEDDNDYYVTKIGCGLAGFTPEQIAPLFTEVRNQRNVYLPQEFIDIIDNQSITNYEPIGVNLGDPDVRL
jgi:hypothetical protein